MHPDKGSRKEGSDPRVLLAIHSLSFSILVGVVRESIMKERGACLISTQKEEELIEIIMQLPLSSEVELPNNNPLFSSPTWTSTEVYDVLIPVPFKAAAVLAARECQRLKEG